MSTRCWPGPTTEFRGSVPNCSPELTNASRFRYPSTRDSIDPDVVWSSRDLPGARLGRGFCDSYRKPLKSSSVIVNGRPDWNVPTPDRLQPSANRLPLNGSCQVQLRIRR